MDLTTNLNDLPPNKRIRLIQQQQQQQQEQEHSSCSLLPTKKRKESRNTSLFHNPPDTPTPTPSIYSLPTKKRVCALQPHLYHQNPTNNVVPSIDLNVEYNPYLHSPTPTEKKQSQKQDIENNDSNNSDKDGATDDDGILCCVCQSTDANSDDPIVFCDGCDLMVHASCYGNPLTKEIPEGDWFCERCRFKNDTVQICCSLCPKTEGAIKQTIDGKWAHLVCALLVPEVFFVDPEGRDGIDCSKVPKKRWLEKCYVCDCCDGCALVCSEPKCGLGFHITCGIKEDLCIEYREGKKGATVVAGFCKTHSQLWEKQQVSGKYKIVAVEDKK